ncbi:DUF1918 domain-containing protein [Baekduia soli]|uniref:DUF1918 domain-containing protein n=1 Tax=Baekduia soli TaxID=496014 RepID=A0A5B8U6K6_9ACTN|nr:DUF1918 domain-containing protein [Baekduia soli]QEC48726.1 DUF1918 domain-containing protein [Baekduia soli]
MSTPTPTTGAAPGDILKARGIHGEAARSAEILEVIGAPGHERYRVRWEDGHESVVFPADGISVVHAARARHEPA